MAEFVGREALGVLVEEIKKRPTSDIVATKEDLPKTYNINVDMSPMSEPSVDFPITTTATNDKKEIFEIRDAILAGQYIDVNFLLDTGDGMAKMTSKAVSNIAQTDDNISVMLLSSVSVPNTEVSLNIALFIIDDEYHVQLSTSILDIKEVCVIDRVGEGISTKIKIKGTEDGILFVDEGSGIKMSKSEDFPALKISVDTDYVSTKEYVDAKTESLASKEYIDKKFIEYDTNGYECVDMGEAGIWAKYPIGVTDWKTCLDDIQYFEWGGIQGYTAQQVADGEKAFSNKYTDYRFSDGATGSDNPQLTKYCKTASSGKDKTFTDKLTTLEPEDDAAHVNMDGAWKMPAQDDFWSLNMLCNSEWVTDYNGISGLNGRLFILKSDSSKQLFIPAAGACASGKVNNVGTGANFWCSGLYVLGTTNAEFVQCNSNGVVHYLGSGRYGGLPVVGFIPSTEYKEKYLTKKEASEKFAELETLIGNSGSNGADGATPSYNKVTYDELCGLVMGNKLIPESYYLITDYAFAKDEENEDVIWDKTNKFYINTDSIIDVILVALSENTLSENGWWMHKTNSDCGTLKYHLSNNTSKFNWASSKGKGIIYRMENPRMNVSFPYDYIAIHNQIWGYLHNIWIGNYYQWGKYKLVNINPTDDNTQNIRIGNNCDKINFWLAEDVIIGDNCTDIQVLGGGEGTTRRVTIGNNCSNVTVNNTSDGLDMSDVYVGEGCSDMVIKDAGHLTIENYTTHLNVSSWMTTGPINIKSGNYNDQDVGTDLIRTTYSDLYGWSYGKSSTSPANIGLVNGKAQFVDHFELTSEEVLAMFE